MNKKTFPRILSLLLTVTMLISSMVVMTIPATAEEVEAPAYVAPEIPTKGETDVWNKTTVTEPTQVDADGYILITSAAEFVYMMNNNLTGDVNNYRLTVNVDLNRGIPAGNKDIGGILDGDGHFVSNFSRNAYSNYFAFNVVSGTIRNLNFKDINIQTQNSRGALISSVTGKIENCHFHFNKMYTQNGAAIANTVSGEGSITNCILSGVLESGGNGGAGFGFGGFARFLADNARISHCANYATVKMTGKAACSPFVGSLNSATAFVENCVNYGAITSTNADNGTRIGGFVGEYSSLTSLAISNCINYGDITAACHTGGIIGFVPNQNNSNIHITMENCYNFGDITVNSGTSTVTYGVGGLAGYVHRLLTTINSANYGNVSANGNKACAGGIVGWHSGRWNQYSTSYLSGVEMFNSANYGDVSSTMYAGGIAGYYDLASHSTTTGYFIYNSVLAGDVSAPYAAHLVGYAYTYYSNNKMKVVLDGSIFSGTITSTGDPAAETPSYYPGILAGYFSHAKNATVTVSASTYINDSGLTTLFDVVGTVKTAADYASYTPSAYSATDMANGTYCNALNAYVNADSEDGANVLWYQSGAQGAPVPVTNLKVSKATVSVGESPAIVALISGVGHLPADAEVELVDSNGKAYAARKADDTRYRFDIAVDLADIGLDETYTVMVNGIKSVHADTISVAGLLGEIYASSTAAEQGLMVAMVNYSYYAGNTTAFDVFNAVAGTALAPSVDGVSEIAGAGALSITEGYEVALDVTNGFVVIVTKGGETLGTYSKSVLNATDVINLGDAGEVTVAAMLNVYLANAETHDLAAAAILYYNAAVAAQDAAAMI